MITPSDPENLKGRDPLPDGDIYVIDGIEDASVTSTGNPSSASPSSDKDQLPPTGTTSAVSSNSSSLPTKGETPSTTTASTTTVSSAASLMPIATEMPTISPASAMPSVLSLPTESEGSSTLTSSLPPVASGIPNISPTWVVPTLPTPHTGPSKAISKAPSKADPTQASSSSSVSHPARPTAKGKGPARPAAKGKGPLDELPDLLREDQLGYFERKKGQVSHRDLNFVMSTIAKERRARIADITDQPLSVLVPFGTNKGSIFSLSTDVLSKLVVGLKSSLGAHIDIIYTIFKTGRYNYERETGPKRTLGEEAIEGKTSDGEADEGDADDMEAAERGTVDKEIFFETYPFLWTLLVLFWTYASDAGEVTASGWSEENLSEEKEPPVAALELFLCAWRDMLRLNTLMDREGRVPFDTLKAPEVKTTSPALEPVIVFHQLKSSFDMLNANDRISSAIKDRLDKARGSASRLYEQLIETSAAS